MPRINIDDFFFSDKRIALLAECCGEHVYMSRSRLLEIWHYCYTQKKDILTKQEILLQCGRDISQQLIESCLAESIDENFRIKGVKDRIDWLLQQSQKGKNSAESRKKKYGTSKPITLHVTEQIRNSGSENPEQPQKLFSNSNSNSNSNTTNTQKIVATASTNKNLNAVCNKVTELYLEACSQNKLRGKTTFGMEVLRFIKGLDETEIAQGLVGFYIELIEPNGFGKDSLAPSQVFTEKRWLKHCQKAMAAFPDEEWKIENVEKLFDRYKQSVVRRHTNQEWENEFRL